MQRKLLRRIGVRLILFTSATSLLIIGLFAVMNIDNQERVLISEVERHVEQLSETVKKSTYYDMLANRRDDLHAMINSIGEEPCIKKVRVFNKDGEITYSADTTEIGSVIDKKEESCYVCHVADEPIKRLSRKDKTRIYQLYPDSARVMGIINPIYNEESCWNSDCHVHEKEQSVLGVLDITVCLKTIDKQLSQSKLEIIGLFFVSVLVLGGIIWFFVRRWVTVPVKSLVEATNKIATGNLNHRIENNSEDELGKLADSFNNMTKKLAEMRTQLVQSDKMASLGQLAAGVAHEINNPLTGVLSYSSFLLKRMDDNPEAQNDLKVIVRETKRCREIVKSLLDFSRQTVPKKMSHDINEIIERAEHVVANQLKLRNISLYKNLEEELPPITLDANQIQQVFINLIINGIDAIESEAGEIRIESRRVSLSPYGYKQIRNAVCPNGHNLIDRHHRIDGLPSLKVIATYGGNEGYVHLDPIYGRFKNHYGIPLAENEWFAMKCPECGISLISEGTKCPDGKAPIYTIEIPEKGILEGCPMVGANWQKWEYIDRKGLAEYIEVNVRDNGSGISKENIEKIYDPFYSTKGQKGTGLGLSVVWGIIENHNGRIRVESEINKGTSFTIRLPINE